MKVVQLRVKIALFFHLFSDLFFIFDQIFQLYLQPNIHSCFFVLISTVCVEKPIFLQFIIVLMQSRSIKRCI